MSKTTKAKIIWAVIGGVFLAAFVALAVTVKMIGVAEFPGNQAVFDAVGQSKVWKTISSALGVVVIGVAVGIFGALEIWQLSQRRSLRRIDRNLWALNVVYLCLVAVYVLFEFVIINYRPGDAAKASFPSSHTMLFATLVPLLVCQICTYIKNKGACWGLSCLAVALGVLGLVGRLLSGAHWLSDILAGLCISVVLVSVYFCIALANKEEKK